MLDSGAIWVDSGSTLVELGPIFVDFGLVSPSPGLERVRSVDFSPIWPNGARLRPQSANLGQIRSGLGQIWALSNDFGLMLAHCGPHFENLRNPRSGTRIFGSSLSSDRPQPRSGRRGAACGCGEIGRRANERRSTVGGGRPRTEGSQHERGGDNRTRVTWAGDCCGACAGGAAYKVATSPKPHAQLNNIA